MPKYFINLKNVWGRGYANKLCELEKMLRGGGGGVMPKYFVDLGNVGGVYQ